MSLQSMVLNRPPFVAALACIVLLLPALLSRANARAPIVAYSWSEPALAASQPNIIPFHWVRLQDLDDWDGFITHTGAAMDRMPEGHRVLFTWDLQRTMRYQNNGDFLYTPDGQIAGCESEDGFRHYRSLWWDNGVRRTRGLFERFFQSYAEAGGKLDVLVMDYEVGFSYWHLKDWTEKNYPSCGLEAYLDAIQNDPRFVRWREELGFSDLRSIIQWYRTDHHQRWTALVNEHLAGYINFAVYEPLKKHFPHADLSNYGYYYQSRSMDLPDIHGIPQHGYSDGAHVGTHQSRALYGWLDIPASVNLGGADYPSTPYNAFRFALNQLRAMVLSSDVPVSPWIAYKGFRESHLKDNDHYQELIFHTLLSGIDYILYWNPSQKSDHSGENDVLLNELIEQVNDLLEGQSATARIENLVDWREDVVITRMELDNGQELWRLTADLARDESIEKLIEDTDPARLRVGGRSLSFEDMRVLETNRAHSDKGLWLTSD